MGIKIKHAIPVNAPVKQVTVENAKGYFDLVVNKNKNGKAIRIADKFNHNRVHVTLKDVPHLIEALQTVAKNGEKTSINDVEYATA